MSRIDEYRTDKTANYFQTYAASARLSPATKESYYYMIGLLCAHLKKDFLDIKEEDAKKFAEHLKNRCEEGEISRHTMRVRLYCYDRFGEFLYQADVMELVNEYAPEHLILNTVNYMALAEMVRNAGSVFLGPYSPESAGDYASGTNHTLPTNGYAKAYNGVNLDSYMRKVTFQELSADGLRKLGPIIEVMAANEQLDAHKNAVTVRLSKLKVES